MVYLTWIRHGLAGALWPAKPSGDRKSVWRWSWAVHFAAVGVILGLLAYFNNAWDLERSLRSSWPSFHRAWLPLLFALSYGVLWLLFGLGRLLAADTRTGHFPDIDKAWSEALDALKSAGIDVQSMPVYLVLGRPAGSEEALFEGAGTPLLPPTPRRNDSPLRVHARGDAIFMTCAGASVLGRQANHLRDIDVADPLSLPRSAGQAEAEIDQPVSVSLLSRDATDLYLARLNYLGRLLARVRNQSCPVNGLLLLIPLAASNNVAEARQSGHSCQLDLLTLRSALRVDCPIYVMVCDLEKATGWTEFAAALTAEQRQRLSCQFPLLPDLEPAEIENLVAGGIKDLMQTRLQVLGDASLHLQAGDGETEKLRGAQSRNEKIVGFVAQMYARAESLVNLVTTAFYASAGWCPMLGGIYLMGTGADHGQTVVAELCKDMATNQGCVTWTAAALAEERRYRRLARATLAAALLLGAAVLAGSFIFYGNP